MHKNQELSRLTDYWESQLANWKKEYRLFGPKG